MKDNDLKYPIGVFIKPKKVTKQMLDEAIDDIESFPKKLKKEVKHLSDEQLDTPYRPDGWTVRQVIHHCADSHMNSYIRFKLAVTEDNPTVKPYMEDKWGELEDARKMGITPSLRILKGLHTRWAFFLKNLSKKELKRKFSHPEHSEPFTLEDYILFYSWHCNHHLAHITRLKEREFWYFKHIGNNE